MFANHASRGSLGSRCEAREPHLDLPDPCPRAPNAGAGTAKVNAVVAGLERLLTSNGNAAMIEGMLDFLESMPTDAEAARRPTRSP